jgi:hypothetical protein
MAPSLLCRRRAEDVAMTSNSKRDRDEVFLEYTKSIYPVCKASGARRRRRTTM